MRIHLAGWGWRAGVARGRCRAARMSVGRDCARRGGKMVWAVRPREGKVWFSTAREVEWGDSEDWGACGRGLAAAILPNNELSLALTFGLWDWQNGVGCAPTGGEGVV